MKFRMSLRVFESACVDEAPVADVSTFCNSGTLMIKGLGFVVKNAMRCS